MTIFVVSCNWFGADKHIVTATTDIVQCHRFAADAHESYPDASIVIDEYIDGLWVGSIVW
jgi:hypothetical protein